MIGRSLHRLLNRLDVFIAFPPHFHFPFPADGKSAKMGGRKRRCFNNGVNLYTELLGLDERLGENLRTGMLTKQVESGMGLIEHSPIPYSKMPDCI